MMMANDQNPLNEILTEKELCDLLGVNKGAVENLRRKHGLPYCRITKTQRLYLTKDIVDFAKSKRMVIDSHG